MTTAEDHLLDLRDPLMVEEEVEEEAVGVQMVKVEEEVVVPENALNVTKKDTWLESALTQIMMTDLEEEEALEVAEVEVALNVEKTDTWQENARTKTVVLVTEEEDVAEDEAEIVVVMKVAGLASSVIKKATLQESVQMLVSQVRDLIRDREEMIMGVHTGDTMIRKVMTTGTATMTMVVQDGRVEVAKIIQIIGDFLETFRVLQTLRMINLQILGEELRQCVQKMKMLVAGKLKTNKMKVAVGESTTQDKITLFSC